MEGTLAGEKTGYDCPVLLKVFGPGEPVARAERKFQVQCHLEPLNIPC